MTEKTEAATIAELAKSPSLINVNGIPFLSEPDSDGAWKHTSLESTLPQPTRKKGTVTLHDDASFIDYCKRHGSLAGGAAIYLNADYAANHIEAVAILNDNGEAENQTGWRDFKASFQPRKTSQWDEWIKNNKKQMNQQDFANFFETNLGDFAAAEKMPTGGQVLEFVSCLQETRTVKYGSAVNLQNGMVKLEFVEDNEKAQKGNIELFKEFALGLQPFFGGTAYQVNAFLRYRIERNSGQITFWYELKKPEKALEMACSDMIESIKSKTGLPLFFGRP